MFTLTALKFNMFLRSTLIVGFTHVVMSDKCMEICAQLTDCANSTQASYCKDNGECFGLFFNGESKQTMCFQGNAECKQNLPVGCPKDADASV